jgi:exodeoxyribonuclease V beta subunit
VPARPLPPDRPAADAIVALAPPRHIPPAWRIGSYSALAHGANHEQAAVDHDLRAAPTPDAAPAPAARLDEDDILRFPRGAAAGECVHTVFERVDFGDPADWPRVIADALRVHQAALGGPVDADAVRQRMLRRLLHDVLATPLPVGTARALRLATVPRQRRLTELEFHLPAQRLEADALNAALAELGVAVPRLSFASLRGYLKGFIDLVLEHDGRYFIVDWKSNHLGDTAADYGAAPLAAAMAAQGYHLQALLYSVALDRLLQRRVPDYDAARHFGGALYLFVRGVRPGWTNGDGTPAGLHFHRPPPPALQRLSALFDTTRDTA